MKKIFLISALLGLLQLTSYAQKTWSLKDCIDYALEHNISIKQGEVSIQQREVELQTARARRLPGVSGSASENFSFGRGLTADNTYSNSNTTSTSFNLGADIPVFTGFDITNGIRSARIQLSTATVDLAKAKEDITVSIAQAYAQILYDEEILSVAEAQVTHDQALLEQVQERLRSGKVSEAEVTAQKATLAQSQYSKTQAENRLSLAKLELSQLLELPSPKGFEIEKPSGEALEPRLLQSPELIFDKAVQVKPSIRSSELQVEGAEIGVKRAKSGYYPTLSVSGGIGTNFYTSNKMSSASFGTQLKNNFSQYIGISLNVPIFSRLSTRNSVRTARLTLDNQRLALDATKKALYKEIQQAYYNAVAAQARLQSSEASAINARDHYNLTCEKYTAGKASIADYNDAKNSLLGAESELLQARYECLLQTRLLDFYAGEEIVF